ncbi:LOC100360244 [Phodopus roborovskii]|uniref:LOC100360244 protein n=1 Tax=Phodopus roborovskii TaxID=109678 RepID=A0AAU9ZPJ7_PHORO|nr:LOC100360244 [Phodopus roborovskii]
MSSLTSNAAWGSSSIRASEKLWENLPGKQRLQQGSLTKEKIVRQTAKGEKNTHRWDLRVTSLVVARSFPAAEPGMAHPFVRRPAGISDRLARRKSLYRLGEWGFPEALPGPLHTPSFLPTRPSQTQKSLF